LHLCKLTIIDRSLESLKARPIPILTALTDGNAIWLGHNSRATVGDTLVPSEESPWLKMGNWAIGVSGESSQQDLLSMEQDMFVKIENDPLAIAHKIREYFMGLGVSETDDEAHPTFGIRCILAHKSGEIWDLDGRMAVTKITKNRLWARGSGMDFALGADHAIQPLKAEISIENRVRISTQAAISNDVSCPGEARVTKFV